MALYYHFANKDEVIDGIVDLVFARSTCRSPARHGRPRCVGGQISVRDVLLRHRWAIGLMEARVHPGSANLRHHDAVIGNLRAAGFDSAMVAHAYSVLDGYIYGFALTKMNLPFTSDDMVAEMAQSYARAVPVRRVPEPRRLRHRARHAAWL